MAKALVANAKARVMDGGRLGNGLRVFVKGNQAPLRPQPTEQQPRMAAAPKGAIHPGASGLLAMSCQQSVYRFLAQNRNVFGRGGGQSSSLQRVEKNRKPSGTSAARGERF